MVRMFSNVQSHSQLSRFSDVIFPQLLRKQYWKSKKKKWPSPPPLDASTILKVQSEKVLRLKIGAGHPLEKLFANNRRKKKHTPTSQINRFAQNLAKKKKKWRPIIVVGVWNYRRDGLSVCRGFIFFFLSRGPRHDLDPGVRISNDCNELSYIVAGRKESGKNGL